MMEATTMPEPTSESTGRWKVGHVRLSKVKPSPENDRLYSPINPKDPAIISLAENMRAREADGEVGVLEPLVVTRDHYILSGHRRRVAAGLAGIVMVPCRIAPFRRLDDVDRFIQLLRDFNRQRVKSLDEQLREAVIDANPEEAHRKLVQLRQQKAGASDFTGLAMVDAGRARARKVISPAKYPFLAAIEKVIADLEGFWPLSDRQIHYGLLNAPPLKHAGKPGSVYRNDLQSYKSLTDLLTRARLEGRIGWNVIADETRPFVSWDCHRTPGTFLEGAMEDFLTRYWRDLMQSQPSHVEIVAEKLTVRTVVQRVAQDYTIPVTICRGFPSIMPRRELARRFRESGKDGLIVLILTDFDPDGEGIAESFARSMRDDFGIDEEQMACIKVALTGEQVRRYKLPPAMKAKDTSARFKRFLQQHGAYAWELEAVPPTVLAKELHAAIRQVIDVEAFNAESRAEHTDASYIAGVRKTLFDVMKDMRLGEDDA